MIRISIVLLILFIHFLADFGLQTNDQARKKSSRDDYLIMHTVVYSLCWLVPMFLLTNSIIFSIEFSLLTFFAHTITDFTRAECQKNFLKRVTTIMVLL